MLSPLTKNTLPSFLALHILPYPLALTHVPALLAGLSTPTAQSSRGELLLPDFADPYLNLGRRAHIPHLAQAGRPV